MKVVGMQVKDVVSKKTGRSYKAALIYVTYLSDKITGMGAMQIYTTTDCVPDNLQLGDDIQVYYNRFGSVESIVKI
jgi:hypothetical protein